MIRIVYHRTHHALTMEGHAGAGEPGKDPVCAAASALAYTLGANVQHLESLGALRQATVELAPGAAEIRCTPNSRFAAQVTVIFDAICLGFSELAQQEQDHVAFEMLG